MAETGVEGWGKMSSMPAAHFATVSVTKAHYQNLNEDASIMFISLSRLSRSFLYSRHSNLGNEQEISVVHDNVYAWLG